MAVLETRSVPSRGRAAGAMMMHEHIVTRSPGCTWPRPRSTGPPTCCCRAELADLDARGIRTGSSTSPHRRSRRRTSTHRGRRPPLPGPGLIAADRRPGDAPAQLRRPTAPTRWPSCSCDASHRGRSAQRRQGRDHQVRHRHRGGHAGDRDDPARVRPGAGRRPERRSRFHLERRGRTGEAQQAIFAQEGVDLGRVIIGHSGDSDDLGYLRGLMDREQHHRHWTASACDARCCPPRSATAVIARRLRQG